MALTYPFLWKGSLIQRYEIAKKSSNARFENQRFIVVYAFKKSVQKKIIEHVFISETDNE